MEKKLKISWFFQLFINNLNKSMKLMFAKNKSHQRKHIQIFVSIPHTIPNLNNFWINITYPTIGRLNPIFVIVSCNILAVFSWGRKKYFSICPTHHTKGLPCKRINLGAKSSGTDRGKNGGFGDNESIIGRLITWVSWKWLFICYYLLLKKTIYWY